MSETNFEAEIQARQARLRKGWSWRWMIFVVGAILGGGYAAYYFPREVSLWYTAGGMNAAERGDLVKAERSLRAAIRWDRTNAAAYEPLFLVAWKGEAEGKKPASDLPNIVELPREVQHHLILLRSYRREHDAALKLFDEVVAAKNAANEDETATLNAIRFELLTQAKRYKEADELWTAQAKWGKTSAGLLQGVENALRLKKPELSLERLKKWEELQGSSVLRGFDVQACNTSAWFRAVAQLELLDAWQWAELAVKNAPNEAGVLDTRGYVLYLNGKYPEALRDCDRAVELLTAEHRTERIDKRLREASELQRLAARRELDSSAAVIRYHRYLVLLKLDRTEDAEKERREIERLGFDPSENLF